MRLQEEWLVPLLPLHICSTGRFGPASLLIPFISGSPSFGAGTWPANNLAIYMPLVIPARFTVARFMIGTGNTTGTVDIGLYNDAGTRLLSTGNTARSGTSSVQYIDVANQSFPPGRYYIALVVSSASGSVARISMANQYEVRQAGVLQESLGSAVLPTSMSPASYTSPLFFHFGFTQSDTL